jgi:hypothetical protein
MLNTVTCATAHNTSASQRARYLSLVCRPVQGLVAFSSLCLVEWWASAARPPTICFSYGCSTRQLGAKLEAFSSLPRRGMTRSRCRWSLLQELVPPPLHHRLGSVRLSHLVCRCVCCMMAHDSHSRASFSQPLTHRRPCHYTN